MPHVLTLRQRLKNRVEPRFLSDGFSCRRRPKRNAENKARMAPKRNKSRSSSPDPHGMFAGMVVFLVQNGVQARRLQVWKQKLEQNGASIKERFSKGVTHVFAVSLVELLEKLDKERLSRFKGRILLYQWLEDSLSLGEKVSEDLYHINLDFDIVNKQEKFSALETDGEKIAKATYSAEGPEKSFDSQNRSDASSKIPDVIDKNASLTYSPPDMNRNITEIFGKLINIYRALGDERRSFSYYKAIPAIEKVPFRIESADQVKDLPGIGKSLQDHIQEIVDTGKLSKLEHFETDEKVKTISLFGEIWGVGPATALKLYDKGHRTLDDLRKEESLTNSQKIGLKYFNDLRQRIPRHEVQEMELLLQKAGEHVLPGIDIVCGGSFRRGKASCGDMDVVITHPDRKSHKGFLAQFIKHLKEIKFLREDLIYSTHSEEGTDSGVDTYFGLCTYPGRELRHRIDLKVYPRDIYAYGLIAWTGNDVLNRRLRLVAESKGFRLDDTGLFPATHGSGGKKGAKGSASLKFETEEEVFDFLGFPCLQPNQRNL